MILSKHDMNKKFGLDNLWEQYQEDFNNLIEILKESNYPYYKDELIDILTTEANFRKWLNEEYKENE